MPLSISHLTLISSISLTLAMCILGTALVIFLPKGDKRLGLIMYGIAVLVGGPLIVMSWLMIRWGW